MTSVHVNIYNTVVYFPQHLKHIKDDQEILCGTNPISFTEG